MFSAISLFVLACAFTVNAQQPPAECSPTQIGTIPTSHAVKLQPVLLQPFIADWLITIPAVPECVNGESGLQAHMCDQNGAPTGYFIDRNRLKIHRIGDVGGIGTVTVTVYCNP